MYRYIGEERMGVFGSPTPSPTSYERFISHWTLYPINS